MGETSKIDIFARVRPIPDASNNFQIDDLTNRIEFYLERQGKGGYIDNTREVYDFKFKEVLGPQVKQDEVFDKVGKPVVDQMFEGINGTVFAYGQTGSGKTFSITGGDERYADRGLIPRMLSSIFDGIQSRSDGSYQIYISYLEIYGNSGYDLLHEETNARALTDLPRVQLRERNGEFHLSNLSMHLANNEEEALNYLFLGDTNRRVAETPMNDVSSRSHCIFMVKMMMSKPGSEVFRTSKVHLVDLAGSERVAKTGASGQLLDEAKYINQSLSFLERCIMQLGKGEEHVSFRDSFMTSVLRDSLGGNCKTVMIATLSVHESNLPETISTCRFAQRVALVKNVVHVNEEVDPRVLIARLKREIRELKEEIALLTGGSARSEITASELDRVRRQVLEYIDDADSSARLQLTEYAKFHHAFKVFKELVLGLRKPGAALPGPAGAHPQPPAAAGAASAQPAQAQGAPVVLTSDAKEQLRTLGLQLQQRDNEIATLVAMLQSRKPGDEAWTQTGADVESGRIAKRGNSSGSGSGSGNAGAATTATPSSSTNPAGARIAEAEAAASADAAPPVAVHAIHEDNTESLLDQSLLLDRTKSFEMFRKSYRKNEAIEANKSQLKEKYAEAKRIARDINESKQRITALKSGIEQLRVERAMQGILEGSQPDDEEARAQAEIESEKALYKENFARMKGIKAEIDSLHRLLEQSRVRLQRDFEQWFEIMNRPRASQRALRNPAQALQAAAGSSPAPSGASSVSGSARAPSSSRASSRTSARGSTVPESVATGNSDADEDIAAFYRMKEEMMQRRRK